MLRATRSLIAARNAYAQHPLSVVSVARSKIPDPNQPYIEAHTSYRNACREFYKNYSSKIIVGWVVQPYDPEDRCTCILHHWWNENLHGESFDKTFSGNTKDEYVIDPTLTLLAASQEYYFEKPAFASLILRDDKFTAFHEAKDGIMKFSELKSLSLEEIRI